MEPNQNSYQHPAELPQPQEHGDQQGATANGEAPAAAPERATTPPATPAGQQPLQPVTAVAVPPVQGAPMQAPASAATHSTSALMADDLDLIEKEWVVKAKAIVAKTKDDPYQQNQAMTKVKADYLKKRYNKDLKVNSEN